MKTDLKKLLPSSMLLVALTLPHIAPAQNQPQTEEHSASPSRQETSPAPGKTATKEERGEFSAADYRFASEAARRGMYAVQAAEVAQAQGRHPGVKELAQRISKDHAKANRELKQLARDKGATLPATLNGKEARTLERLQNTSGPQFDQLYTQQMIEDHQQDVTKFRKAAEQCDDPELKSFAQRTDPVLEEHLQAAQELQAALQGAGAAQQQQQR